MIIDYIQDVGHGWFKISPDQQRTLGVSEGTFSPYSYISEDGTIYAEEDCDCGHIFRAVAAKDIDLNINPIKVNGDSWIRTLPRCTKEVRL
tara:strand:+ start:554 stop:826 length:273 start_codon:yes stop_codon:yes gene_type:complete